MGVVVAPPGGVGGCCKARKASTKARPSAINPMAVLFTGGVLRLIFIFPGPLRNVRWVLVLVLLAVAVYALETEHFVVTPDDQTLAKYLEEAYSFYVGRGLKPAPPCQGTKYQVYVDPSNNNVGDTHIGNRCIEKIVFRPQYTPRLVYHEVGHVFFESYKHYQQDLWVDEAVPEAMASVATGVYYFPQMYFQERLYRVNPFALGVDRLYDWYKYSAPVAWYLQSAENWADVLTAFSTREVAASLYVKFLLELNRGVALGQTRYEPEREAVEVVPGAVRKYPDLPGYTAVYYNVSVPHGGVLKISVEGTGAGRVVSNVALGKDIVVANGTLLVVIVNNSSQTLQPTLVFYFSSLQARVVDGVFEEGGRISVRLYAEYNFERVSGVVKVNGTSVRFVEGYGVYNFTGAFRRYVLVLEYGDSWTYVYLNLTRPAMAVAPSALYLDRGGRGALNVTIYNQNQLALRCVLNGSGLRFKPVDVFLPRGNATFRLEFQADGQPPEGARVFCGPLSTDVNIYKPSYSLYFDLDSWSGALTAGFGQEIRNYTVRDLPANVSLHYNGYVVGVVSLPRPALNVTVSQPRLEGAALVYTLSISVVGMPTWVRLRGTVKIDGDRVGEYRGGVVNKNEALRPGESRRVEVSVGKLSTAVVINAPSIRTDVEPISAVVEDGKVSLLAEIRHNVEVAGNVEVKFENANVAFLQPNLVVLSYPYDDMYTIRYVSFEERYTVTVSLPRPEMSVELVKGVVSPDEFHGLFNITLRVCGPSVDARYVVNVDSRTLTLNVKRGDCASNSTLVERSAPFSPMLNFTIATSFGRQTLPLSIPPPQAEAQLRRWVVQVVREVAEVALTVRAPSNYTYVVLGREVVGEASFDLVTVAINGTAVVDYGFGSVKVERPKLLLRARPVVVEVNVTAPLEVEVAVPSGLYVNSTLQVGSFSRSVYVEPGNAAIRVDLPGFAKPGIYNLSIILGPYLNYTRVVAYRVVNLTIRAPPKAPVGLPVAVSVEGRVEPSLGVGVVVDAAGCVANKTFVRLNSSLVFVSERPCVLRLRAHTNTTEAGAEVEWASLTAEVQHVELGRLRGLPIFPVRGVSARVLLGGSPVDGQVRLVGDFDKLGLVNFTIYVEYMGVVNMTSFVGFAVPPENYAAANNTMYMLPADARPYFRYLVERAVATGDWAAVDKISRLYSELPTPFTLAARFLVERALAAGREPNVDAAEALRRLEPVVLGILGGFFLAVLRRGV